MKTNDIPRHRPIQVAPTFGGERSALGVLAVWITLIIAISAVLVLL
ncbi:hypothetical protein [Nocardia sp. NPDC048505]